MYVLTSLVLMYTSTFFISEYYFSVILFTSSFLCLFVLRTTYTIQNCITLRRITSHHTTPLHTTPYSTTKHHISHLTTPDLISHLTTSQHTTSYHNTSHPTMSYFSPLHPYHYLSLISQVKEMSLHLSHSTTPLPSQRSVTQQGDCA